ncbi:MAG: hypothetical protein L0G27_07685 [Paracoccus sp. (in: a-proteobacteria)]|nr:hypothetical protein [Paracoccus sp. (in: a-proteobacteria)]
MFNSSIKTLMLGGKVAAIATLMAGTAMAQTTTIATPQGNDVTVSDQALDAEPSLGMEWADGYPVLEEVENNDAIIQTMIGQGFSDLKIVRKGPMLTITGQRAGVPTELVYSTANGRLVSVDGVETRDDASASSSVADKVMDNVADGAPQGDMADDQLGTDTLGGTATDSGMGTDAGADLGADSDAGMDAGSDTGADTSGSDAGGSDTGASDGGDAGGDAGGASDGADSTN